jgi:hypothetical protein
MTTHTVTIKNTQTGKAVPGFKVTGLTLAEVEEARQVFFSHSGNVQLKADGLIEFVVKPDAPKYNTLKLTDDQVQALIRAIRMHSNSYEGVEEEDLEGTGVLEAIELNNEILAKFGKMGWNV